MNKYLVTYGKPRYLGILTNAETFKNGTQIVVESVRGEDIAIIVGQLTEEREAEYRAIRNTVERPDNAVKITEPAVTDVKFIKIADEKEFKEQAAFRADENNMLRKAKEIVVPHDLDIKIIDVEMLRGRQKLYIYFSSEQRVDFRAYVRDLAKEFRTRIELRQIGVRDETKIVGGLGMCGHRCCCCYWLHQFVPVSIKMVKEQNLALNPTKISGICGRLMCCMCYEHNVYSELWEGLPSPGSKLKMADGNITISGIDIGAKAIKCYIPGLGEKPVAIDKFEEFQKAVEEGKTAAELEELIKTKDDKNAYDALEMDIFKDIHKTSSEQDTAEDGKARCKGLRGRHGRVGAHRSPSDINIGADEEFFDAEEQREYQAEIAEKRHSRPRRRGDRKHHYRPANNGGAE